MSERLQSLASRLVLGTERAPGMGELEPEEGLLDELALAAFGERCGQELARVEAPESVSVPPSDPRPQAPRRADRLLGRLLERGRGSTELEAWIRVCTQAGFRPSPGHLPRLLDLALEDPRLLEPLARLWGPRGTWLAARVERWSRFSTPSSEQIEQMRAAWDASDAGRKMAWLERWPVGPSTEIDFERALDDRVKPVRALAAKRLIEWPESALLARLQSALVGMVRRSSDGLELRPPSHLAPSLERDGIEADPPTKDRRSGWVSQILARVPVSLSEQILQGSPAELVQRAGRSKDGLHFLLGWSASALRAEDQPWLEALAGLEGPADGEVLAALEPRRFDRVARRRLAQGRGVRLLAAMATHPTRPTAALVLELTERSIRARLGARIPWHGLFVRLANGVVFERPDDAERLLAGWDAAYARVGGELGPALARGLEQLERRRALERAFTSPSDGR